MQSTNGNSKYLEDLIDNQDGKAFVRITFIISNINELIGPGFMGIHLRQEGTFVYKTIGPLHKPELLKLCHSLDLFFKPSITVHMYKLQVR